MTQLPVYVINLDRRPDRLATIVRDLDRLELSFERVTAVDAHDLSEADSASASPFVDPGAVACIRSHAEALRRLLLSPHPAALILEDDAELAMDAPALCQDVDWWPDGTKVIKLEAPTIANKRLQGWVCGQTPSGRDLRAIVRWNAGAVAYLVNRKAARALIASYERQDLHTDRTMFDPRISEIARWLRPVQVVPAAARHRGETESDLAPFADPSLKRSWRRYIQRNKAPRWMALSLLWWATGRAKRMCVRYEERAPHLP